MLSASALALLSFSMASAAMERSYSCSLAFSKSFKVAWCFCCLLNYCVKQHSGIEPAINVVDDLLPHNAMSNVNARVNVNHQLLH